MPSHNTVFIIITISKKARLFAKIFSRESGQYFPSRHLNFNSRIYRNVFLNQVFARSMKNLYLNNVQTMTEQHAKHILQKWTLVMKDATNPKC